MSNPDYVQVMCYIGLILTSDMSDHRYEFGMFRATVLATSELLYWRVHATGSFWKQNSAGDYSNTRDIREGCSPKVDLERSSAHSHRVVNQKALG
jgi:hypothetical protein